MNSALAFKSSLVAMATNSMARSSPRVMYAHWRMERMDLVAAMPLLAMRIRCNVQLILVLPWNRAVTGFTIHQLDADLVRRFY